MTTLVELFQELSEIKAKAKAEGLNLMKKEFVGLFERYPEVKAFRFKTWIPSFNDGDACEFTLGELYVNLGDVKLEDDDDFSDDLEEDGWQDPWSISYYNKPVPDGFLEEFKTLNGLFQKNDEIIEYIVDANSDVTITPSEIRVDEYWCGY